MPNYDAFGREVGENTLSGLGGAPVELPPAPDEQRVPAAQPTPAPDPGGGGGGGAPAVLGVLRRIGVRRLIRLAVGGLVIYWGIQGAQAVSESVGRVTEEVRRSFPTVTAPGTGRGGTGSVEERARPAKPPVGLEPGSLMRRRELSRALAKLRAHRRGGRLLHLRVAPERIDTQIVARGQMHVVQVRPGAGVQELASMSASIGAATIAWEKIDSRGAERLARAASERMRIPLRRLDYAVASQFSDAVRWVVYFKNGRYAIGTGAGRFERAY